MASIQVIQGADTGRNFELTDGENVIGRESQTVYLTDETISRRHARLISREDQWILEDLGSANGTFLNNVKVTAAPVLTHGDQIRCGETLLVFSDGEGARAAVDLNDDGQLVDVAIVATVPSNEDSVIIPTPEAGKKAIENLRILYDVISEISPVFNVDQLLSRMLNKVVAVLAPQRGYAMLIDENGKNELKASYISPNSPSHEIPVSRTIIDAVLSKQVGLLSSNAMSDKRFASGKSVHDLGIRSAICVPIKGRERILGIISVDTSVSDQTYSTEQLRLLTAIGYQTGLAVENARLYEATVQSERLTAVGETVAFLSHHIKNILQALGAGADVVEMGLGGDDLPKAREAWPIVQRNLARINELILNMLAFSKHREPAMETINVNRIVEDCLELLGSRADERGAAILNVPDDLPAIPADGAGLHQALLNLLTNALEAVADQTGVVTVTSSYDSMNRNVVIVVGDNGRGIEPDNLTRIFTPFYSDKGHKGTGLGLAVTRKIIREHSGKIEVDSTVGEGTTFTVTLPAIAGGSAGDTRGPAA